MNRVASLPNLARRGVRLGLAALVSAQFVLAAATPSQAQSVPVVRDAEIEALVREYVRPIFEVAGLSKSGIEIVLVNDRGFNAFVAGRRIFVNAGALMMSETPNEIIGVLAHEVGHLAGGHQERLREQLARAQTMAVVALALGIGATVAGAATDSRGLASAGGGIALGGQEMARRGLLGYQRTEETTADRSALTYLEATKQSAKGMLKTFARFQSALSLSGANIDPYQTSHPMPRERIANLETLARESPYFDKEDSPALQSRHDMMRAKIAVYMEGASGAKKLFRKNPTSAGAAYGDAVATYLYGNPRSALVKVDALIASSPKNPYFQELRGDVLMKSNKPEQAAAAYASAVKLDPAKSGILQIAYGQALLATGKTDLIRQAVGELRKGLDRDKEFVNGYAYLAQAYNQLGEVAEAELATAESHFYSGKYKDAKVFAARAQSKVKRGSPAWIRAQDIINFKQPGKKNT
ncbi:MAG: M48 family metallopeptidase [Rhizobiaceae bacterium]|nr:M48 family metallopeptidase [Rhizobiaceae bacterium]